jgi:hypothetical protein
MLLVGPFVDSGGADCQITRSSLAAGLREDEKSFAKASLAKQGL